MRASEADHKEPASLEADKNAFNSWSRKLWFFWLWLVRIDFDDEFIGSEGAKPGLQLPIERKTTVFISPVGVWVRAIPGLPILTELPGSARTDFAVGVLNSHRDVGF